jgi:hypothetical protein
MTYSDQSVICNNNIYGNSAYIGGGAVIFGGYLINNTISDNDTNIDESNSDTAGNLYTASLQGLGFTQISNNIICNAKSGGGVYINNQENPDGISFTYNNVCGNLPTNYVTTDKTGQSGNISSNPFFSDNYHISSESPCRDAGDPNSVPYLWQLDIDGEYAMMGRQVDIGADEYHDDVKPLADAGGDQYFDEIVTNVTLDGSGSYDPNGNDIAFQWRQISGAQVQLFGADTPEPNFTPVAEDVYVFELVVFNSSLYSRPDCVIIVVGNRKPMANAGSSQNYKSGHEVTLDGSGSYDPDIGDTITYSWTQVSGPIIELGNPQTINPRFTPTACGEYVFELIVSDGTDVSLPDTVTIYCLSGSIPDTYGYRWIDSDDKWGPAYYWIDFPKGRGHGRVTDIENDMDQCYGPISLGFNFNFYGNTYSNFYIQTNGLISFDSIPVTYSNKKIPAADGSNNIIAWMWTYMYPSASSQIDYKSFDDYMVIQFIDYRIRYGGTVTAEVILYKNGKIVIQYKDFSDDAYNYQYTVGIENSDGTIGTQAVYNTRSYLHDELAVEFALGPPYEPVADAGTDRYIDGIELVTLDGSSSYRRDMNDVLYYQWVQISGEPVILSDLNSAKPTFMPVAEGEYWFELVVSDGAMSSYPDNVLIYVGNRPPVAQAGQNQACKIGQEVTLNGSYSSDPDKTDILSYTWTQVSGPAAALSNPLSPNPRFTPSAWGEYVFELIVSDGIDQSLPDTVTIYCIIGSLPDAYGYRWLDSDNTYGPTFNWIDIQQDGNNINGIENTYYDSFGPFPIGFDFEFYGNTFSQFYVQSMGVVNFGSVSTIDGYNSIPAADEYNNLIAWLWYHLYPQEGSKAYYKNFGDYTVIQFVDFSSSNANGSVNAEVILYKSGRIAIQYKDFSDNFRFYGVIGIENSDGSIGTQVVSGNRNYLHDELVIEFSPGPFEPVANAGNDQHMSRPGIVTLDGTKSYFYGPDGITSFQWTQTMGPAVEISDPNSAQPTFMSQADSEYGFELIVGSGTMYGPPDEVKIVVHDVPPIADAGPNRVIDYIPLTINLDASSSYDPYGDSLTYHWNQVSGPDVLLNIENPAQPTFTPIQDAFAVYTFELTVNDGYFDSNPDRVEIVLDNGYFPVADAGLPAYAASNAVSLDGTGSYDPDNSGELRYSWRQITGPSVVISDENTAKPTISGFVQTESLQICKFELVVYDDQYESLPDTVEVRIVQTSGENILILESDTFDPNKPTVIYFSGGDGIRGSDRWNSDEWEKQVNLISFI